MISLFQIDYTKDAEKSKHDYNLPADAPQFVKAKEVAENISDVSMKLNSTKNICKIWNFIEQLSSLIIIV